MAAPVREVRATSRVGRLSVPVKCPVSQRMIAARTMPRMTATAARIRSPSTPATAAPVAASTVSGDAVGR